MTHRTDRPTVEIVAHRIRTARLCTTCADVLASRVDSRYPLSETEAACSECAAVATVSTYGVRGARLERAAKCPCCRAETWYDTDAEERLCPSCQSEADAQPEDNGWGENSYTEGDLR